MKRNTETQRMP